MSPPKPLRVFRAVVTSTATYEQDEPGERHFTTLPPARTWARDGLRRAQEANDVIAEAYVEEITIKHHTTPEHLVKILNGIGFVDECERVLWYVLRDGAIRTRE